MPPCYALRGGSIFIRDNAGYRAGIHMKAYGEKQPVLVIGGRAGSFLGEYQAGGTIVVLNRLQEENPIVSFFPGTGMHGGKLFLRSDCKDIRFPEQVTARPAADQELQELLPILQQFCSLFRLPIEPFVQSAFTVVTPNSANPYRQLYVSN